MGDGLSQMVIQMRPYAKFQSFIVTAATGNDRALATSQEQFSLSHAGKSRVSLYCENAKASGITSTN
jgi:hypothetical protein